MQEWLISADTGGTFTDCLAEGPDGSIRRGKVLSSGRLRTLAMGRGNDGSIAMEALPLQDPDWLLGNLVWIAGHACGTILEMASDRIVVSEPPPQVHDGDIIEMDSGMEAPVLAYRMLVPEAKRAHPSIFFRLGTTKGTNALLERKGGRVALFLTAGFEDLLRIRDQKRPELFARQIVRQEPLYERVYGIRGRMDTNGVESCPLDVEQLTAAATSALAQGCDVAVVSFLNSWANVDHECLAERILIEVGFSCICVSSGVRPLIKYLDRSETALVNGLLSPVMDAYLDRVQAGIGASPLGIMTSAGGLVSRERFHAVDSLVSGPAGGMLGAIEAGRSAGFERIIALDMGGTSTDVSRWKERLELRQQIQVGQAHILTPAMPIETVAAGGGSICGFRDGRLFVGPESAGADPGPAAYGAGGPLCLTDIHLLLGRMDPEAFSIPVRMEDTRQRLNEVMELAGETDWRALAEGFLAIATERMAHAIRQVTLRDGEDPAEYGLVAFGGAGGLHACRLADELGIGQILFPADAGILSAKGIHRAPRETVLEQQLFLECSGAIEAIAAAFTDLEQQAREQLAADGLSGEASVHLECTVFIRIRGQEKGLPVSWSPEADLTDAFKERFEATFGYYPGQPALEVVKLRLRMVEDRGAPRRESFAKSVLAGPRILSNAFGTCFIEEGWKAVSGDDGSYLLSRASHHKETARQVLDNVRQSLVMNRLEGLVEEMGDQLQRTAISTNIRERLDFSCALLDRQGRLLVNAPHIPVHLGAMGLCVRECRRRLEMAPGDVIITNHPACGGSHLPDVTLMTGLFDKDGELLGYLANRAHHAELGGLTPGSMPPDAASLAEEGVVISPRYLIREGLDRFPEMESILSSGAFPSRATRENRIDLEAQLASLQRGQMLFQGLLDEYPSKEVSRYFIGFYTAAADALSGCLCELNQDGMASAERLDDGHCIRVRIQHQADRLQVDFSGTDPLHPGNLNATPAIVRSAVLYVLRLLVDTPMPLNEGLLDAVDILLPKCFLNPDFPEDPARCPAVVGGNVETSQRIVDALVRALGLMAAGQGTMNNFLFGNKRFGYYETIGGGAGAGAAFPGASGVHVHMTNTAITDPEILEQRFPVQCRQFSLRKNSGGAGLHKGGDGLVREIVFHEPVTVSLLTQNRITGPKGMAGGTDGLPGRQWLVRKDGRREEIDGITRLDLSAGEGIRIETPGGGGWGTPVANSSSGF